MSDASVPPMNDRANGKHAVFARDPGRAAPQSRPGRGLRTTSARRRDTGGRAAYDAIVIGSGAGGLTAALATARAGHSVLVLEAGRAFGGYLNPFARKRFHFDPGLHYVGEAYQGGPLRRILDDLQLDVAFNELSPSGFDRYVFPGYELALGKGFDRLHERLRADFPAERRNIDRFMRTLRGVNEAFGRIDRVSGPLSAVRAIPAFAAAGRWRWSTLGQMLGHYFRDPYLKAALAGPCGDLGLPPGRLSALYYVALLTHYLGGAFFPRGGSGALRDAYVGALRDCGAVLRLRSEVVRIVRERGRVSGVVTADGQMHRAPLVISNASAKATLQMAGLAESSRRLRRKLRRLEPSLGSVMAFLGVQSGVDTDGVGDANVWHYASTDIDAIYGRVAAGELPNGEMLFISVPSLKDPNGSRAPAGHHVIELVALASAEPFAPWFEQRTLKRDASYNAQKEAIGRQLIATAERYLPGLKERIVIQEISTPATNRWYVNDEHGAIYGPAHTPRQVLGGRFSTTTELPGLLLCGSSVICGGVYACIRSGHNAGRTAVEQLAAERPSVAVPAPAS